MTTRAHILLGKIEYYIDTAHHNLMPESRAEIRDACNELGAQIDSMDARLHKLETWADKLERQRQQRIEKGGPGKSGSGLTGAD